MNNKERIETAWQLGKHGFSISSVESILRIAPSVRRHAENWCNVQNYDAEKHGDRLRARLDKIETPAGWHFAIHGDPRGCVFSVENDDARIAII